MSRKYRLSRYSIFVSIGWLFADLLLALAMLFLLANTFAIPKPPQPPPTLTVTPTSLDPANAHCTGGTSNPRCTLIVGETASSQGTVQWKASSDISDNVAFNPPSGVLSPGKSVAVTITAILCQNGSFAFSGSNGARTVTISWHCTPPPTPLERLDFNYKEFSLTVHDINGLLNDSQSAINDIEQQVRVQPTLQGSSVGLAIVYGGTLNDFGIPQAQTIAQKVYNILKMLGGEGFAFQRASYYVPLYTLGADPSSVKVDVYLFTQ